ncbi:MAG TPA: CDGSH iron-sulfur domain-containing protein [Thermomicrobiaceae bacterium]|nr:CDGSH iron-sulfur domain-containing protein [Thermomicrobiaceae bacterium]
MAAPDETRQGSESPASGSASSGQTAIPMRITVTEDGPYLVEGGIPVAQQIIEPNEEGASWEWRQGTVFRSRRRYQLCRCGQSQNKPFCDGSHETNGFIGTETASRAPYLEQAKVYEGPELTLTDAEPLCASARFCDACGSIWNLVEEAGAEARALTIREAGHCPSGRLVAWKRAADGKLELAGEPEFEKSIGVVEDPEVGCSGPLWVRGGIEIVSADGTAYQIRNRVTLCRCGQSQNKPFCDGSHRVIDFQDGLPLGPE